MSPLSILSGTGINVKSSFNLSPLHTLSTQRLQRTDMAGKQENIPPQDPFLDEEVSGNRYTFQGTNSTRQSPTKISSSTLTLSSPSPPQKVTAKGSTGISPSRSAEDVEGDVDDDIMDTSSTESHGFDPDNTCFSTFSAVPNMDMTAFARLGQNNGANSTPIRDNGSPFRKSRPVTPGTAVPRRLAQSPTKTPSKLSTRGEDHTTQLLEFTEQFNYPTHTTSRQISPIRSRGQDLMAGAGHRMRSPEGRTLNLLDFDIPPAPTPRSIPTISARELESLKAGFLSEISSLKAKLSGAQAEISSLKEAKDDAERRVGTLSEELRDANGAKLALQQEKEDWQKHDSERREALAKLKNEYVAHDEEISRLREEVDEQNRRFQDMENRAGDAEGRLQEAEGKLAGYREEASNGDGSNPTTPGSNKAVEVAVEKVAKELHLLYKSKHEQKVAALKQSYEKRWKKKVDELAFKVEELEKENTSIRNRQDATFGGEILSNGSTGRSAPTNDAAVALQTQNSSQETDGLRKEVEELTNRMENMSKGVTMLERDNVSLRSELEESRKENSDLVTVVDEMLAIDLAPSPVVVSTSRPSSQEITKNVSEPATTGLRPRTSTSKISGLRGPGFGGYGESRIGGSAMGLKRSTSGNGSRSGIMSNIERMGRGIGGRSGQE